MLGTALQSHLGSKSHCFREWDKVRVLRVEKHKAPYIEQPQNSQVQARHGLYVQTAVKNVYRYQERKACFEF